jgi:hypothetical protein
MTLSVDLFGRPAQPPGPTRQLALPLNWRDRAKSSDGDILVGTANAEVVAALRDWPNWRYPIAMLYGAPRSGKSTLAGWFRSIAPAATVIDPAVGADEDACFHACNRALDGEGPLLLTFAGERASWCPALPDLATRVAAAQQLSIALPDSGYVAALLQRRLADAALHLPMDAARYIAERSERSYVALDRWAAALIQHAHQNGQRLSVPVVRTMMSGSGDVTQSSMRAGL